MSETTEQKPRKKLVAGNWKMNGSFDSNEALILGFLTEVDDQVDVSVFCPNPYLAQGSSSGTGTAHKDVTISESD